MEFPTPTLDEAALETLESQITEVWGHINTATYRFLELLGEFDRTRGWARHGLANCAQWLNWQCGINGSAAREKVRVARALDDLPKISDSFRQGRVSYSKVRAMTRVATPDNEATLLNIALHGTASHVEKTVRKFVRVRRDMDRHYAEAVHLSRYLDWWHEDDGSFRLQARLAPEVAEVIRQAIEAAESEQVGADSGSGETAHRTGITEGVENGIANGAGNAAMGGDTGRIVSAETNGSGQSGSVSASIDPASRVSAETPEEDPSPRARRADALRHMAEQYLAHRADISGSAADRYQVVVHIAQEDLSDARMKEASAPAKAIKADSQAKAAESAEGADSACAIPDTAGDLVRGAELERGGNLAVATARRLGCDGSLVGLVENAEGEPLDVGRKTRAIPAAIRRALRSRDGGCRFPGCDHSRFVHAHHIRHWADGGETKLGNLVTLCSYHHHLVHEGGYGIEAVKGGIEFTRPDGRALPASGWDTRYVASWREQCFRGNIRVETGAETGAASAEWIAEAADASGDLPLAKYTERRGVTIDAKTSRCGWRGEVMDYGLAIEALCWQSGLRV